MFRTFVLVALANLLVHAAADAAEASSVAKRVARNAARPHLSTARHQSKVRRNRLQSASPSMIEVSGHNIGFPSYPRADGYAHPLDASGKKLEADAVSKVTPEGVMNHLKELVDFPTRSYSNAEESDKVEHYLKRKFESMGFTTCLHSFKDQGDESVTFTNVVAHLPGASSDSVTVGAHYDSRPFDGKAPGAEDNGSGVASVLAIAKAFAETKVVPKSSVYFVAFAGEEPGLVGSKYFAEALHTGGGDIPAECKSNPSFLQVGRGKSPTPSHQAIIMDEIGWASPALSAPTVNLESFDWTKPVMDHLRESSQTHNGDALTVVHNAHPFGSDHMSFLDNEMMAVLTINGDDEAYPHYHQSSDTIENVNPNLLSMITKMNLGALIRMVGVRTS